MKFFKKQNLDSVKLAGKNSKLNKTLTGFDLIILGLGGIVGTGVFALTGFVAAQHAGPAVVLSYIIAGFTCVFVALVYTELATMLPTSGSIYTYTYVAFGQVFAWLVGGLIMIEIGIASAAVAGSWSGYIQGVLKSAGLELPAMLAHSPFETGSQGGIFNLPAFLIIVFIGFTLYLGTKESKKINNFLVFFKMSAIFIFVLYAAPNFDATNWENFMPYGVNGVLYGSSILFFAYTGFGTLASTAEECKNPKRDLIIGIIGSVLLTTLTYVLVATVLTGAVSYEQLDNAEPLAYALRGVGRNWSATFVATGAIAGMTSVLMINIYGLTRIFYVIARDGLLPQTMAKLHHKYGSPYITIILFTTVISLMAGFLPYAILAQLSSMAALTDYIIVGAIVLLFRFRHPTIERPFKCPLVFIITPFALLASFYLLLEQIIGIDGQILLTGKIFITWFIIAFFVYLIKFLLSSRRQISD